MLLGENRHSDRKFDSCSLLLLSKDFIVAADIQPAAMPPALQSLCTSADASRKLCMLRSCHRSRGWQKTSSMAFQNEFKKKYIKKKNHIFEYIPYTPNCLLY